MADRDHARFAAVAGQVLDVGLAAGIEYSAGLSVRPWNAPFTTTRLIALPAWRAPGSVMVLAFASTMRAASETDSRNRN